MKIEEIGSFEIVRYEVKNLPEGPKIVVSQVKVLDKDGKYIKFAKLEKVLPFLSKFPIRFKEIEQ
jgi:hypothetical protein